MNWRGYVVVVTPCRALFDDGCCLSHSGSAGGVEKRRRRRVSLSCVLYSPTCSHYQGRRSLREEAEQESGGADRSPHGQN